MKWPHLCPVGSSCFLTSCQTWPFPKKSTLVPRQEGSRLLFVVGAEDLVEQELVGSPQGAWASWEDPYTPQHPSPAAMLYQRQPGHCSGRSSQLECLMLRCPPDGAREGYHVHSFEWETAS